AAALSRQSNGRGLYAGASAESGAGMSELIQICEPGQTPLPHADTTAIGIDLGTTHSVVAISSKGKAEPIHDLDGRAIIPSIVQYDRNHIKVGREAQDGYMEGEAGVIASVKRLMGKAASDVSDIAGHAAYDVLREEGALRLKVGERKVTPVEVSSEIL